ncbi:hypothetical protein [Actinoplanes sp. HUAS TT8]|uniref:hypothetical protein n=1 Tax=Actinoplanes sp. HUAS TT8 TaxID=3447453 RepID=UPI003F526843
MFALYAWGNFIREAELDRLPAWLDPAVLDGSRQAVDDNLTLIDEGPMPVDGPATFFDVDGRLLTGRDLIGRDLTGSAWRVAWIRVATDGTRDDALRITDAMSEAGDVYVDDEPERNPLPLGEIVTVWEDEHGQWDLALVRL